MNYWSRDMPVDPNEPIYCNCRRVAYGEMICCDSNEVSFHMIKMFKLVSIWLRQANKTDLVLVSNGMVSSWMCWTEVDIKYIEVKPIRLKAIVHSYWRSIVIHLHWKTPWSKLISRKSKPPNGKWFCSENCKAVENKT